jgi:hypothetical protein
MLTTLGHRGLLEIRTTYDIELNMAYGGFASRTIPSALVRRPIRKLAGPSTQRPIGRVEADEPARCELKVSGRMLSEVRENTVQCVPREYIYPVI